MKKLVFSIATGLVCLSSAISQAASVTFTSTSRPASAAETGDLDEPVPAGSTVFQFSLTSDADILNIKNILISNNGSPANNLYQNSNGDNVSRPSNGIIAAIPAAGADSWIRLAPTGKATLLGVDMPGDGTPNTAWGDLVTTPAASLQNFQFAQFTLPNAGQWAFTGVVVVDNAGAAQEFPFSFEAPPIPEPATLGMASMALIGLAAFRRRK